MASGINFSKSFTRRSSLGCVLKNSGGEPAFDLELAILCQNFTDSAGLYPAIAININPNLSASDSLLLEYFNMASCPPIPYALFIIPAHFELLEATPITPPKTAAACWLDICSAEWRAIAGAISWPITVASPASVKVNGKIPVYTATSPPGIHHAFTSELSIKLNSQLKSY